MPDQIGISRERLRTSFEQALYIRRRFTILDAVQRTGLWDSLIDRLFGSAGPWQIAKGP
jgi:glycerol-1-phosphate dehydrogenase [NAD(P)+]